MELITWALVSLSYGILLRLAWIRGDRSGWDRGFEDGYRLRKNHDALMRDESHATGKCEGRIEMLGEILAEQRQAFIDELAEDCPKEQVH